VLVRHDSFRKAANLQIDVHFLQCLVQGCTNAGHQVAVVTKVCTVVRNVCGSSVWNLLHVNVLAPRILKWLPHFWEICALLVWFVGRDSVVVIATGYELDVPGIESRWRRDFPHPSREALGPIQPPIQCVLDHCRR
jgi:hypothetical protein